MSPNHRFSPRSKLLIPFALAILLLGAIFLPGPNGLISVLVKTYRIRQYRVRIEQLKAKADSLERKIKLWQDQDYATRAARRIFSRKNSTTPATLK
ncbi:MAG: FtsB family cell division protein [bacterium]